MDEGGGWEICGYSLCQGGHARPLEEVMAGGSIPGTGSSCAKAL